MWLASYCANVLACCHVYFMTATHSCDSSRNAWIAGRFPNYYAIDASVQATCHNLSQAGSYNRNRYSQFYYIFGEGTFKILSWLMTLLTQRQKRDPKRSAQSRACHLSHSKDPKSTNDCIENSFGWLKNRYHCLRDGLQ